MLAKQLKQLEDDKIIIKKVYPVLPPKTEYTLTTLGYNLENIILGAYIWGDLYNSLM